MSGRTGLIPALEYHVVNSLGWPSLRPLQRDAVGPVRSGADCLLVAPTAGGKTEAALFPLLSEMVEAGWRGLSVIYVTPLRALLNNLHPRVASYAAWLGRTVGLWHGDVGDGERRRLLSERPDILLTTPESLEAMLVSRRVDHRAWFAGVRAVVVDELHAFAGDDRGWHLLSVLERVERLGERRVQRVGLSATVGNPPEMLRWLQGSGAGTSPAGSGGGAARPDGVVVLGEPGPGPAPEVTLDYVGTVENAARVISLLHRGEKRLAFCESRKRAEELTYALRELGVTTFVSHSSLSADERRLSERAFAEARDCVIVATSTLELGVDIGDLDRVIQVDAPRTVASFLQRLGRTGRRPGSVRNTLFLAVEEVSLLRAAGLLLLWARGFVEPVVPPASPRHIAAQQLLALALQEGRFGASTWRAWWGDLPVLADGEEVLGHLRTEGFLAEDGGVLFLGPAAEKEFGRRYFMDLLSAFTTAPELRVIAGTKEVGTISPLAIAVRDGATSAGGSEADRLLLLAGRAWHVEAVSWERHEVYVHEVAARGKIRWEGGAVVESFELSRAQRDVLLGADPEVILSKRALARLATLRAELAPCVNPSGLVLTGGTEAAGRRFWTWAGLKANETLLAAIGEGGGQAENAFVQIPLGVGPSQIRSADVSTALPLVTPEAVRGLKFSAALPAGLATATLAERFVDREGAADVVGRGIVVRSEGAGE